MRNSIYVLVVMLCCVCGMTAQTIHNPFFEARMGSIGTITKVERTSKFTKVYVHVVFRPHWWITVEKTMYLEDVDTGERYFPTDVEGLKFGEQFYLSDTGEADYVLTYPPLPKEVKKVNWIDSDSPEDCTYGISLVKQKKKKPTVSVVREEWMAANPPLPEEELMKAGEDFTDDNFFHTDTAYISGVLDNYHPVLGFTTAIVYMGNELTREDMPTVVTIQPDGKFEGKLVLNSPRRLILRMGAHSFRFYLEPGEHLSVYLDWEDFLARSRARIQNFPLEHTLFGGKLAAVNAQLALAPRMEFDYYFFNKDQKELTPEQYLTKWGDEWGAWASEVKAYSSAPQILPKVKHLLMNELLVAKAVRLFNFQMSRPYMAQQDTANAVLKVQPTLAYYDFVKELPWDDVALVADESASEFINRMEYELVRKLEQEETPSRVMSISDNYFLVFLKENGIKLEPEENEMADWFKANEGKSIEVPQEQFLKWSAIMNGIMKRDSCAGKLIEEKFQAMNAQAKQVSKSDKDVQMYLFWQDKGVKLIKKFMQVEDIPFLWQQVVLRSACSFTLSSIGDRELAIAYVDSVSEKYVTHPFLQTELKRILVKIYPDNAMVAFDLPAGRGADIFRKLIAPFRGKALFVDFWATFCGPCRQGIEDKALIQLRAQYRDSDQFQFVYITCEGESPQKDYDSYVEKHLKGENCFRLPDSEYEYVRELFHFNSIPRYVIISKDGKVITENYREPWTVNGIDRQKMEEDIQNWIKVSN